MGKLDKAAIALKMLEFYKGNKEDINHFLKVYAYAEMIGRLEELDKETEDTLEVAAIVHDIACPLCREKYGNTNGNHQEAESEDLLREFLPEFNLPEEMYERVIFLVCHHHTYTNVKGMDWQILLEADYLVNASENPDKYLPSYRNFRDNVYKTAAGKRLLASLFPEAQ